MKIRIKKTNRSGNRQGITLLFVVSMIVLFLLMGTAFVIVANDYFRAARKRAQAEIYTVDRTALVHRTFYNLVRGAELSDRMSPFRGHDLLSDQYGYGLRAYVNATVDDSGSNSSPIFTDGTQQFVQLSLAGDLTGGADDVDNALWTLHNPAATAPTTLGAVDDLYSGLVITFVSGPVKGLSTRILQHRYDSDDPNTDTSLADGQHYILIPPVWLDTNGVAPAALVDSEVIINGREFSGRGAGEFVDNDGNGTRDFPQNGSNGLLPNRAGYNPGSGSFGEILSDFRTNYLGSFVSSGSEIGTPSRSVNESYDAADYYNMFLSGRDSTGNIIPSFHRRSLYEYVFNGSFGNIHRASFRPSFIDLIDNATGNATPDGIPDPGSKANANFAYNQFAATPASATGTNDLDVDTDFDGTNDSVFIDPGYDVITSPNGLKYKPLVAIQCVDLDGRINVNAHGNLTQVPNNRFITQFNTVFGGGTRLPSGEGYGPAEIDLGLLFGSNAAALGGVLGSRYGTDGVPGDGGVSGRGLGKQSGSPLDIVDVTNARYGTVNRNSTTQPGTSYTSGAMNIHGRFSMGTPSQSAINIGGTFYSDFRDWNSTFNNALPVIDMEASGATVFEFANNPYEMSFAPLPFGDSNDDPYTAAELERILRQFDPDANMLPQRLWDAPGTTWSWDGNQNTRQLVTTESYEVQTLPENFKQLLATYLLNNVGSITTQAAAFAQAEALSNSDLFAPELFRGLKMDMNRPFGNGYDDDGDGVVDNPSEVAYAGVANVVIEQDWDSYRGAGVAAPEMDLDNDGLTSTTSPVDNFVEDPRVRFARHLYMLTLLLTDDIDVDLDGDGSVDPGSYEQIIAQWAINVADFRDADSIMTRFQYDTNPWDGWSPNEEVWGLERPELLISETLNAHVRRTEDLVTDSTGGGNAVADGDTHFDSRLRPEPFSYIELYNPWTQNQLNQRFNNALYGNSGLQLNRYSQSDPSQETPVWRMTIERPGSQPSRFVYFADPDIDGNIVDDDDGANQEIFYPNSSFTLAELPAGAQAVVGTLGIEDPNDADHYRVFMGRLAGKTMADEAANNLDLDNTRSLTISQVDSEVVGFPSNAANTRSAVVVPITDSRNRTGGAANDIADRRFSISDPFGGYPTGVGETGIDDGVAYPAAFDEPLDHPNNTDSYRNAQDLGTIYSSNGMTETFRVVKLQRLANPSNTYNATTNPYITIDTLDMDLITLNGLAPPAMDESSADPANPGNPLAGFGTSPTEDTSLSLERGAFGVSDMDTPTPYSTKHRELWSTGRPAMLAAGTGEAGGNAHNFPFQLVETMGATNDSYVSTPTGVTANNGFPALTWNNRPFVSHLELMNIPYASADSLTQLFTTKEDDSVDPFAGEDDRVRGRFKHLLNFYANDDDSSSSRANLYRLMEYVEVPSRFLGTESRMNAAAVVKHPFNVIPRYRVPGKVNLNTIYNDPGTAGTSTIWNALQGGYQTIGLSWTTFLTSRDGSSSTLPTDFENPFRPCGKADHVPSLRLFGGSDNELVVNDPQTTLFRSDAGGMTPLFDFDEDMNVSINSDRSAYFRNIQRSRLSNLTTNRSSVFAIWITVAYFEVDGNGLVGEEVGIDTGEAVRNRGFYVFDRSIPMAFEPGRNHNVERGILVQSIIE